MTPPTAAGKRHRQWTGDDLDGKLGRLRARVEAERRRVEELNCQAAERRAEARALRAQAAGAVETVVGRQHPRR